jgi:LysM repeat protein
MAILTVLIVVLGLGACARSAEVREGPDVPATSAPGGSAGQEATAAPGETVVSAVTPVPQATEEGEETGDTGQPEATDVPDTSTGEEPTEEPPVETGEAIIHVVQAGETLISIARDYGTSWAAIAKANNLVNADQISVGQELKIPTSEGTLGTSTGVTGCRIYHTVKRGEWVWQIARVYGVPAQDVLAANGLTVQTADPIYPGTELCIP